MAMFSVLYPPSLVASEVLERQRRVPMQEDWICPKLKSLADQLRYYKAPIPTIDDEDVYSRGGKASSETVEAVVIDPVRIAPEKRRAAVLICLYEGEEGELRVILTKRAGSLRSHSGEVALPGGKRDEGDVDDTATALREANEEIGLVPSMVRVVTSLEPFLSKNLLRVTPVIGLLNDLKLFTAVPNPTEVDAVFDAPLEMFLKDEKHTFQDREWMGVKYRVHFFDYTAKTGEKFTIWGLTASMLIRTASIVYTREPSFPDIPADYEHLTRFARGLGC